MRHWNTEFDVNNPQLVSVIDEAPCWSAPFGEVLLNTVRLKRDITVLDVGSGTGYPLVQLADRLGSSARLYGLDPWSGGNERVRLKIRERQLSHLAVLRGSAERLPLVSDAVDLLISNNGLNNVQDLDRSLAECYRVCRAGAQLVITVNLPHTMHEFYRVFVRVLQQHRVPDAASLVDAHIRAKRLPLTDFTRAIKRVGFEVMQVHESVFYWRYLDGSALLSDYVIRLAFLGSWKELVPEAQRQAVFTDLEQALNTQAADAGEFRLTIPFVCIDAQKSV